VILDTDGATELGRLQAGQEKTVASFTAEIQGVTRYSLASLEKLAPKLGGALQSEYRQKLSELGSLAAYIAEWKRRKAEEQFDSVKARLGAIQAEYALGRMPRADRDAYAAAKAKAAAVEDEWDAWLATNPANSSENQRKHQAFGASVAAEKAKMDALVLRYLD
jgi:hypothetical protein